MARGTPDWGAVAGGVQSVAEFPSYTTGMPAFTLFPTPLTILSVFNPADSGIVARLYSLRVFVASFGQQAVQGYFTFRRISSSGTGTEVIPVPHDSADGGGLVTARYYHTVEPITDAHLVLVPFWLTTKDTGAFGYSSEVNLFWELYRHMPGAQVKPLVFRPGEGYALHFVPLGGGPFLAPLYEHTEEPE